MKLSAEKYNVLSDIGVAALCLICMGYYEKVLVLIARLDVLSGRGLPFGQIGNRPPTFVIFLQEVSRCINRKVTMSYMILSGAVLASFLFGVHPLADLNLEFKEEFVLGELDVARVRYTNVFDEQAIRTLIALDPWVDETNPIKTEQSFLDQFGSKIGVMPSDVVTVFSSLTVYTENMFYENGRFADAFGNERSIAGIAAAGRATPMAYTSPRHTHDCELTRQIDDDLVSFEAANLFDDNGLRRVENITLPRKGCQKALSNEVHVEWGVPDYQLLDIYYVTEREPWDMINLLPQNAKQKPLQPVRTVLPSLTGSFALGTSLSDTAPAIYAIPKGTTPNWESIRHSIKDQDNATGILEKPIMGEYLIAVDAGPSSCFEVQDDAIDFRCLVIGNGKIVESRAGSGYEIQVKSNTTVRLVRYINAQNEGLGIVQLHTLMVSLHDEPKPELQSLLLDVREIMGALVHSWEPTTTKNMESRVRAVPRKPYWYILLVALFSGPALAFGLASYLRRSGIAVSELGEQCPVPTNPSHFAQLKILGARPKESKKSEHGMHDRFQEFVEARLGLVLRWQEDDVAMVMGMTDHPVKYVAKSRVSFDTGTQGNTEDAKRSGIDEDARTLVTGSEAAPEIDEFKDEQDKEGGSTRSKKKFESRMHHVEELIPLIAEYALPLLTLFAALLLVIGLILVKSPDELNSPPSSVSFFTYGDPTGFVLAKEVTSVTVPLPEAYNSVGSQILSNNNAEDFYMYESVRAMNHDGTRLVISTLASIDTAPNLRIMGFNASSSSWEQIGDDIEDRFFTIGDETVMSGAGSLFVVGVSFADDEKQDIGYVSSYELVGGTTWIRADTVDETLPPFSQFGEKLRMNADGNSFIASFRVTDSAGVPKRRFRIFMRDSKEQAWRMAVDYKNNPIEFSGDLLDISSEGKRIIVAEDGVVSTHEFEHQNMLVTKQNGTLLMVDKYPIENLDYVILSGDGKTLLLGYLSTRLRSFAYVDGEWRQFGQTLDTPSNAFGQLRIASSFLEQNEFVLLPSISHDGNVVAFVNPASNTMKIWHRREANIWCSYSSPVQTPGLDNAIGSAKIASDGKRAAIYYIGALLKALERLSVAVVTVPEFTVGDLHCDETLGDLPPSYASAEIQIETDSYPEEVSWEITDRITESRIAQGKAQPSQRWIVPIEGGLEYGNYTFTIHDTFGDGFIGGSYKVSVNGITVVQGNGNFTETSSHVFEVPGDPIPPDALVSPTNIPDPNFWGVPHDTYTNTTVPISKTDQWYRTSRTTVYSSAALSMDGTIYAVTNGWNTGVAVNFTKHGYGTEGGEGLIAPTLARDINDVKWWYEDYFDDCEYLDQDCAYDEPTYYIPDTLEFDVTAFRSTGRLSEIPWQLYRVYDSTNTGQPMSLALSASGTVLAVGCSGFSFQYDSGDDLERFDNVGFVWAFSWQKNLSNWKPMGKIFTSYDMTGGIAKEFGHEVALSGNGKTLFISAVHAIIAYSFNGTEWNQKGQTLWLDTEENPYGPFSVACNDHIGNTVVVSGNLRVRVFSFDAVRGVWVHIGQPIDCPGQRNTAMKYTDYDDLEEDAYDSDFDATRFDISSDSRTLLIYEEDGSGASTYKFQDGLWMKTPSQISFSNDHFYLQALTLSADGLVAVVATLIDTVRFRLEDSGWTQEEFFSYHFSTNSGSQKRYIKLSADGRVLAINDGYRLEIYEDCESIDCEALVEGVDGGKLLD